MSDLHSIACGFLPLHFLRWSTDRRSGTGRCPTGRRRIRKSGGASCGHLANFNCELNLTEHRRMSAGWVLYHRRTQDGCSITTPHFCRIRATDRRALIRQSIWLYCDVAIRITHQVMYLIIYSVLWSAH